MKAFGSGLFLSVIPIVIASIAWWEGMEKLEIFVYHTAVHFTDQNWITKTVYCIRCVMACKIGFTNWNAKIPFLHASMVVTYYIKLFRTDADRQRYFNVSSPSSRRDNNNLKENDTKCTQFFHIYANANSMSIWKFKTFRWIITESFNCLNSEFQTKNTCCPNKSIFDSLCLCQRQTLPTSFHIFSLKVLGKKYLAGKKILFPDIFLKGFGKEISGRQKNTLSCC